MICENIGINDRKHLTFAGVDTVALAEKHGTPLYLMDENRIRHNCRVYKSAMAAAFGEGSVPAYAGKAACFRRMYEIMAEEGMDADLVSAGEIYTAKSAGFPMERTFFHGNNKTDGDIRFAMDCGVGCIVVDGPEELSAVNAIAGEKGICQNVLLRLTPGIDPHTYEAVATGKVDSKFGVAIETGQAEMFVADALACGNIRVLGYHCHVGSMVFDDDSGVYSQTADAMLTFAADMYKKLDYAPEYFDIGGGYGVRYTENDPYLDIPGNISALAVYIRSLTERLGLPMPKVLMEPGRSIVADAGMTLYTAGVTKEITGYKNYLSVDGGMTDNPRYALYGSRYTVYLANRMGEEADFACDLVGRCCESGDIIQPGVVLPKPHRGDVVAVCTTGAYNYSMASNYNRIPRPPVVMIRDGADYVAVARESLADLIRNDR